MAGPLPLVFGIFGGGSDDDASIAAVADRLDAPASEDAVLRELDHLSEATDRLVADASLDRLPGTVRPDDGPVQKVEALAEAVDRGTLSFEDATRSGRTAGAPAPTSADVVSRVDAGSLASPDAQRLLDTFAASGADADAAAQSLETVLRDAEAAHAVGTALDYVGEGAGADVEMARKRLSDAPEAALVEGVDRLCERVVEADRRAREAEERCRELERAIADATGETDPEVDPEQALADIADGGTPTDDGAADAATAVRRRRRPQSELARTLLDAFAGDDDDPEPVLERAVEAIDEAETVRGLVGSVDPDAVDELAAGVETAASAHDGQVASKLTDRVAELRRLLDGAPETNQVTQYAVQNELRFYDRHLLPALSSASASAGTGDAAERVESLVERRQSVSDRWISGTSDYNHSIPLHFLSLVDSLHQEAETALNAGESVRAREIADAGATVLDYVEQLYEQNEYSVMLRRLRG